MHYKGFVFVKEPTEAAVAEAMEPHKDTHWDWHRCGGRWDGYFQGPEEQKKRETHDGFNYEPVNEQAALNCCKVADLRPDQIPYFFVCDFDFVPKEYYNAYEKSPHGDYYGAILDTPNWRERWERALKDHANEWVVVVDAHD